MDESKHRYIDTIYGPKSRKVKLDELIARPDCLDIMCNFVACGGTLINFAKLYDVSFPDLMKWIRADKERTTLYNQAVTDRKEFTVESILQELRTLASFDVRQLYDDQGRLKPIQDWPANAAAAVAGIEVNELFQGKGDDQEIIGMVKKIKLWDKNKSIEQLGKTLALYVDRVEETKVLKLEDLVRSSYLKDETTKVQETETKIVAVKS